MARGDHHAEIGAQGAGQHGHRRGRHRADQDHINAHGDKTGGQCRFDQVAGQTGILADQGTVTMAATVQHGPGGHGDTQGRFRRHGFEIGSTANAIGTEIVAGIRH